MDEKGLRTEAVYSFSVGFFKKLYSLGIINAEEYGKLEQTTRKKLNPVIPIISINPLDNRCLKSDVCNEVSL